MSIAPISNKLFIFIRSFAAQLKVHVSNFKRKLARLKQMEHDHRIEATTNSKQKLFSFWQAQSFNMFQEFRFHGFKDKFSLFLTLL